MSWEQWPFRPRSLTEMVGPSDDPDYSERFVSLLVSGCSERLGRPLTVLEPELDTLGEPIQEPGPDNPAHVPQLELRRIDHINPQEHFSKFCEYLRTLPGQEEACRRCDEDIARKVIQRAIDDPKRLGEFLRGYSCRMNLIDQAGVIRYHRKPVAVVFSGQFLPEEEKAQEKLQASINALANEQISGSQVAKLHTLVDQLDTCDDYIEMYILKQQLRGHATATTLEQEAPTAYLLFRREVEEIERIACAQYQMHRRNRESKFRDEMRNQFMTETADSRERIGARTQPILEAIRMFCGTSYLALFVSPQLHISYEGNRDLLAPLVSGGIQSSVWSKVEHFNWSKARFPSGQFSNLKTNSESNAGDAEAVPPLRLLTEREEIVRVITRGLIGKTDDAFADAAMLCWMHLSDAYRAVLLWGPFSHLTSAELAQETRFLEEISEMLMVRVLSSVQLSDSVNRTSAWGNVATLLAHHSRRAMTPVSTGVRIISDYLRGGRTYSKENAQKACESLETASEFISQAVRSPLASFVAVAEQVYEFGPASLEKIVRECVALYQPMAAEKGITIEVDSRIGVLPKIEVDSAKIRDAIGYVVDNAIKYSHRDKAVRIYGHREGRNVRLMIEDFGQGIREDERHLLFERGYQGERSRKAVHEEGEGMGLFHARLIVAAHKGRIGCDWSSGPRFRDSARLEGYRVWFTIELPIKQ